MKIIPKCNRKLNSGQKCKDCGEKLNKRKYWNRAALNKSLIGTKNLIKRLGNMKIISSLK